MCAKVLDFNHLTKKENKELNLINYFFNKKKRSKMNLKFLMFFFASFWIYSCGTTSKTTNKSDSPKEKEIATEVIGCNAVGVIRDYRQNGNCQYLIELQDGTKLLPIKMPVSDVPFYEGAGVKVGYKKLGKKNDVIKGIICDHHDMPVEITCIEEYLIPEEGQITSFDDCVSIKNPYKITWLRKEIESIQPTKIMEYKFDIGYLYEFITPVGSALYDCLGNHMCSTDASKDCISLIETLKDGKLIFVKK